MANYEAGPNDPMAVKFWQNNLAAEVLKQLNVSQLIGEDAGALLHRKTQPEKGAGDQVTFGLRMQLTGRGKQGHATLEGNEEGLDIQTDAVVINKVRHAVKTGSSSSITQQRVPFNVRQEAMDALVDWAADRLETSIFNQLCGYTPEADTIFTGNQAVVAPDADHVIRAGAQADDESLTSSHPFVLNLIDKCVERAKTLSPAIRPLSINGGKWFVMFLHPYQVTQLRTDASTAGNWIDFHRAGIQGGNYQNNPIFTGALGVYNNTILMDNTRVTQGVHSGTGAAETDVRRAVFAGAQAAAIAFGQNSSPNSWEWKEELFDFGDKLGVSVGSIFGIKKTRFASKDYATITVPTYAVAAT